MCNRVAVPKGTRSLRQAITTLVKRFQRDNRGNILILFVLMSSVLFLFVGGAVDYARYNSIRADVLESLDASSLAMVRMEQEHRDWTDAQLIAYGEKFFVENANIEDTLLTPNHMPYNVIADVLNFDMITDDTRVNACIDATVQTHFLALVQLQYLKLDQCSSITKAKMGRTELALVLDMTGSMEDSVNGEKKIDSLKKAVVTMLDIMFEDEDTSDRVRVGVVPFNLSVNPGGASSWQSDWGDLAGRALYNGARFIHVDENGNVDVGTKVNHYTLYASDPDSTWSGCVESRPYPLDEVDFPAGVSPTVGQLSTVLRGAGTQRFSDLTMFDAFVNMPAISPHATKQELATIHNSRFVPVFRGDEADCNFDRNNMCAKPEGDDYWVESASIQINGVPTVQRIPRSWFVDLRYQPSGVSSSKYYYRNYIDDELYIGRSGTDTPFYARVVEQFRALDQGSAPFTQSERAFRDAMIRMGVGDNRFIDPNFPETGGASTLNYDEYILRGAYVGWWDPATQTYKHKYDLPKLSLWQTPGMTGCPPPILPLTNDRLLIDGGDADGDGEPDGGIMAALFTRGSTNVANGAMWGWRVVSDEPPFTESIGPRDRGPNGTVESDWQRAVVILTDGNNSVDELAHHLGSNYSSYGFALEERMGAGIDGSESGGTNGNMIDEMNRKLLRICHRMKQDDILVFTIVFDVSPGEIIDTRMKSCASSPVAPFYFNTPTATELDGAFDRIAKELSTLHVSE